MNSVNWVVMKIKNEKQNTFLFLILGVTLCLIIGLAVGIAVSQDGREGLGSYARAIDLLEKYPLIDGFDFGLSDLSKIDLDYLRRRLFIDTTTSRRWFAKTFEINSTSLTSAT